MDNRPEAVFSGVFILRDGVSEAEFLPTILAFYQHLIDAGFARAYRVLRRLPLEGFGKTLPPFTYRGELQYPDSEQEDAAYAYVKKDEEPIRSLHRAMNSKVRREADFFLEVCVCRSG